MIDKLINKLIKYGLRLFALTHLIEVCVAIMENAYITASVAFVFGIFDLIASLYIKECNCDEM